MRHMKVRLEDILSEGAGAGRFSFSFEPEINELADSIEKIGLVNPPTLRSSVGGFEIVCGLKRVGACKNLGFSEIDARVYETDELPDEQCLWFSLIDNTQSGRLSPVECAIALRKFSEYGYDADRLAKEIAPLIGLPSSKRYIENYLELLSLDKEILHALHDGSIGVEQAFCLREIQPASRAAIFHVLLICKTNLNETRELVSLIPDVAAMKGMDVSDFIHREIAPVIDDDSLQPRKKLQRMRDYLKRARYPRLTGVESAFQQAVDEMKLGERCRISPPKNFEGEDIVLNIRAESAGKLGEIITHLCSTQAQEGFRKLFSILRGNKGT